MPNSETIYWLTREWADRLYTWRNGIAVGGGLILAIAGGLGYWGNLARDEFARRAADPNLFDTKEYFQDGKLIIEIRPHGGRLHPFVLLVPTADRGKLLGVATGPSGSHPNVAVVLGQTEVQAEGKYSGLQIENPVDSINSAYVTFSSSPSELVFGQRGGELRQVKLRPR